MPNCLTLAWTRERMYVSDNSISFDNENEYTKWYFELIRRRTNSYTIVNEVMEMHPSRGYFVELLNNHKEKKIETGEFAIGRAIYKSC